MWSAAIPEGVFPFGDAVEPQSASVGVREVVAHQTLAGSRRVGDRRPAVDEVGRPEEQVALPGGERFPLQPGGGDPLADVPHPVVHFRRRGAAAAVAERVQRDVVAAGVVEQLAGVRVGVLQGDPGGDQFVGRAGGHVQRVDVIALLAPLLEVERVAQHDWLVHQPAQDAPHPRVEGHRPHVRQFQVQ